jgi:hypothetical protein
VINRCRFNFFQEARIWYNRDSNTPFLSEGFENVIVLTDEFYAEVMAHPIPTDVEVVKTFASAPAGTAHAKDSSAASSARIKPPGPAPTGFRILPGIVSSLLLATRVYRS